MKRLFNHRRRPYEDKIDYDEWEEFAQDTEGSEYDSAENDYIEEDAEYGDVMYDAEGVEYDEDNGYIYGETEEYEVEEGCYAEETALADDMEEMYESAAEFEPEDAYFAGNAVVYDKEISYMEEDARYEEEDEYYSEEGDEYYSEEEVEGPDDWLYEEEDSRYAVNPGRRRSARKGGRKIGLMDGVMILTGAAALVVALIAGVRYANERVIDNQVESFVAVGSQLADIKLPGQAGLLAVADEEAAKKAAAEALAKQEQEKKEQEEEKNKEYNEQDYKNMVTVVLNMSSIQKDLKIKFVNKNTDKLISNVPFVVTVTDPDGKTSTWTDDDMDGIIYKTKLSPGSYKVAGVELTSKKHQDYYVPTTSKSVEVKEDIEYKKVDVKNEIKTEAEVNVNKEDTKKNETQVEEKLDNTVDWVESTTKPVSFKEIDKTVIVNPLTVAYAGSFQRLAQMTAPGYSISEASKNLNTGESFTLKAAVAGVNLTQIVWTSSNPEVVTVVPVEGNAAEAVVTAVGAGSATVSYTVSGTSVSGGDTITNKGASCTVTVTVLGKGSVVTDKAEITVVKQKIAAVKATATGFAEGKELIYTAVSNKTEIATATCDTQGNLVITGVSEGEAEITVSVNYKGIAEQNAAATLATAVVKVKVIDQPVLTFEKTAATAYINTPLVLKVALTNAPEDAVITAQSSDTGVATVEVKGKEITVTGLAVGSTTVTAQYVLNDQEIKAVCTVTVKQDPKLDKVTLLKDINGNLIYVQEDGVYREAVYADYYTAEKFYVKGNVSYTGWQTIEGKVYYFDAAGKKVTGAQIIQGAQYNFDADGVLYTGSGIRGIDVSKWNGNIDWKAVKNSGIEYVIIRCGYRGSSQGMLIEDPKYQSNIKGATQAGLKVGVYFFTQAISEAEAIEEASMVLEQVKNYKISYPIFLDVEASGGRADGIDKATRTAVCKAFCQTIQSAGYTAGIYANKTWLETKMDANALSAYKIWLAQYAVTPTYSGRYDIWQYQSTGKVSGISGNVDMNWSYLGY